MSERTFVDMPHRISHLPRDHRGFPVPKFVEWIDGKPDFRVASQRYLHHCVKHNTCWLCGAQLGRHMAFVIGPMCAINRINSEPPSHYECALFAARYCPFLSQPRMRRNEKGLPEKIVDAAGIPIQRNPGCCCIWVTNTYKPFRTKGGLLFDLGPPTRLEFYAEGRPATRQEVEESVRTGIPLLEAADAGDPTAGPALAAQIKRFVDLLDVVFLPQEEDHEPDHHQA